MSITVMPPGADIFASGAEAIVIPVNCVGVPGKGLALEASRRWPSWAARYRLVCDMGALKPGGLSWKAYGRKCDGDPVWVVALATKDHWRNPSRLTWVRSGLRELVERVTHPPKAVAPIGSVAMPALGSGLGGLSWADVRPMTEQILGAAPGVEWMVYEPHEAAKKGRTR